MGSSNITPIKTNFNLSGNRYSDWTQTSSKSNETKSSPTVEAISAQEIENFTLPMNRNNTQNVAQIYTELLVNAEFDCTFSSYDGYVIGEYNIPTIDDYNNFLKILEDKSKSIIPNKYDFLFFASNKRKDKYGVDNIFLYYNLIDQQYGNSLSFDDKLKIAYKIDGADKKNNYRLAHSYPLIETGAVTYDNAYVTSDFEYSFIHKGEYMQFFNEYGTNVTAPLEIYCIQSEGYGHKVVKDESERKNLGFYAHSVANYYADIMDETIKYPSDYKKKTLNSVEELGLVSFVGSQTTGITVPSGNNCSNVVLNLDVIAYPSASDIASMEYSKEYYATMISIFNHEFAHAYDNVRENGVSDFTNTEEWKTVFEQIEQFDSNHSFLGRYAYSSDNPEVECFAEVMAEYLNYNGSGSSRKNPNDLKAIEIDYNGYTNLYDYVENLVGKLNINLG